MDLILYSRRSHQPEVVPVALKLLLSLAQAWVDLVAVELYLEHQEVAAAQYPDKVTLVVATSPQETTAVVEVAEQVLSVETEQHLMEAQGALVSLPQLLELQRSIVGVVVQASSLLESLELEEMEAVAQVVLLEQTLCLELLVAVAEAVDLVLVQELRVRVEQVLSSSHTQTPEQTSQLLALASHTRRPLLAETKSTRSRLVLERLFGKENIWLTTRYSMRTTLSRRSSPERKKARAVLTGKSITESSVDRCVSEQASTPTKELIC
jgi:hypothetical protein